MKHAEIKPYQCERCGERFARLDYLRRHNSCSDSNQCKKFMKGPRRKFRYTKADGGKFAPVLYFRFGILLLGIFAGLFGFFKI